VIGYSSYRADSFDAWQGDPNNVCPLENQQIADPNNVFMGPPRQTGNEGGLWWGCAYNDRTDRENLNLKDPVEKDTIMIMRRSWAKIRFEVNNPGIWIFHCHVLTHMMDGMEMAFNFLPDEHPPIPDKVRQCGPCEIWNRKETVVGDEAEEGEDVVMSEAALAGVIAGTAGIAAGAGALGALSMWRKKSASPTQHTEESQNFLAQEE
jgi:hypothetical protein